VGIRNSLPWDELYDLVLNGTLETLYMVFLSGILTIAIGLPLGVLLFVSRPRGLAASPKINVLLGAVVNVGRSLPFVVLLIALIPLTRLIVGTTLGSTAAVVPITLGAIPFFARIVESALDEVDAGRIEAIQAMGGNLRHIIFTVLLPEALPALLAGVTLTLVMLIGFSSMAGVIGGGGLGDLAIRYGYQRFNNQVMVATIVVLVVMVQLVQSVGDRLVRSLAHKPGFPHEVLDRLPLSMAQPHVLRLRRPIMRPPLPYPKNAQKNPYPPNFLACCHPLLLFTL